MRRTLRNPVVPLLLMLSAFYCAAARAENGAYSDTGGAFSTGTATGQSITIQGASLAGHPATLSLNCPITSYGVGAYLISWACAGGSISIASTDGSLSLNGTFFSGSMSFSGSGGGRGGHTSYAYQFFGTFEGVVTAAGVTEPVLGSLSQVIATKGQLGSGTAAVTSGSLGWNSAYSPLIGVDAANGQVLSADNLLGSNLQGAGSFGSGIGQFESIDGLAQDASGRIYATDATLDRLVRVNNLSGNGYAQLGTPGSGVNQFSNPHGIAIDAGGKIWVVDTGNNRVVRFDDLNGTNWTVLGTAGAGVDQWNAPTGVAIDAQGRVYVADTGNNRVVRFDDATGRNWTTLTQVNISIYGYPIGAPAAVAVNAAGQIYIGLGSGLLLRVNDMAGTGGSGSYYGTGISSLSLDPSGTLYVAGNFAPGLAQVLDGIGTGYFPAGNGTGTFNISAVLATKSSVPTPSAGVLSTGILDYGSQNVGEPTASHPVVVTNLGSVPMTVQSVHAGPDYKLINGCTTVLSGGASCTIGVQFSPTGIGAHPGTLVVDSTGVHPEFTVTLSGMGTLPTAIVLPATLGFDPQQVGTSSGAQLVTLLNSGSGPLNIASIVATGDFTQTSNCPAVLLPGSGCTLQVVFKPSSVGARSGTLTITDDVAPGGQVVALTGLGTSAAAAYTLAPESLLFPDQLVGAASASQAVTLTNRSAAIMGLGTATYPTGFRGASTCPASLGAGASCTYTLTFAPAAAGLVAGMVSIPVAGHTALVIPVSGTAVPAGAAAALVVSPASVDFGQQTLGDTSSLSVTISNSSGRPSGIASVGIAGSSALAITSNNCPSILAGAAACTLQITYVPPNTPSIDTATLTIAESSGAQTQVPVTGSAVSNGP